MLNLAENILESACPDLGQLMTCQRRQHRAISRLQRDAHRECTLKLRYLRWGRERGEEGNKETSFFPHAGRCCIQDANCGVYTKSEVGPRGLPCRSPDETGSRRGVARPRKRDTAILSKRPRRVGDPGEGQLRLLPSFLMSPVRTISSRSISRRRRIKLPRHSVLPQLLSP